MVFLVKPSANIFGRRVGMAGELAKAPIDTIRKLASSFAIGRLQRVHLVSIGKFHTCDHRLPAFEDEGESLDDEMQTFQDGAGASFFLRKEQVDAPQTVKMRTGRFQQRGVRLP
jgi:hypothetical protein